MSHDFTPVQESIVTPTYNPNATILIRGDYDFSKSDYAVREVTAYQVSEAFTSNVYLEKKNASMRSGIADVKEYLTEGIQDGSIDTDVATEIAERLGIELTKTLRVEFTVRYSATVRVPLDSDLDESDFSVRIDANADGDWDDEDYDIEDFSAEEIDSY